MKFIAREKKKSISCKTHILALNHLLNVSTVKVMMMIKIKSNNVNIYYVYYHHYHYYLHHLFKTSENTLQTNSFPVMQTYRCIINADKNQIYYYYLTHICYHLYGEEDWRNVGSLPNYRNDARCNEIEIWVTYSKMSCTEDFKANGSSLSSPIDFHASILHNVLATILL